MSDTTKIEWTATHLPDGTVLPGYTFNPWTGCTKVSPGCDHCYAEGWSKRSGHVEWGPHGSRRRTSAANWAKPIKWNAEADASGIRRKVFCASLADVFDNHGSITSGWHGDLWHLIARTPHLDWLLLTKRPQNIAKMLPESYGAPAWGNGWPNVWLGTTCENQTEADRRIPQLLRVPAKVNFISGEPLLSQLDLTMLPYGETIGNAPTYMDALLGKLWMPEGTVTWPIDPRRTVNGRTYVDLCRTIDWVITGGESGPGARPMHPDWARSLRDQCTAAGVPFFFKQWGEWLPYSQFSDDGDWMYHELKNPESDAPRRNKFASCCLNADGQRFSMGQPNKFYNIAPGAFSGPSPMSMYQLGKSHAGRQLDGREWNQMPGVV